MKKLNFITLRTITSFVGVIITLLATQVRAQITTWDPQGANAQNPYTGSLGGLWESSDWDTASETGTNTPVAWVEGTTALFAVNTGAGTPAFTHASMNARVMGCTYVG